MTTQLVHEKTYQQIILQNTIDNCLNFEDNYDIPHSGPQNGIAYELYFGWPERQLGSSTPRLHPAIAFEFTNSMLP